ncbi:uncharacterized protein LOC134539271 [Bacillus rossius redtenbacheri]|uniref:uncharacterized protein LOC134539271 n=1 Tax=Bacillus rossius redtenbacheri TaxID=93214 RepID=UPI002FDD2FA2
MLSNKEHLTKILNVHAGENLVETALNTGSANPMVGWCKRIEGIHISSTVYKHEPPENMESIDYIVKPNKVNYLASLNPLPTTINHQDLYHVTDNEVNANALSTIKDFTQKYGEFLYCKVKVNPQMTISRSFLLEMSIMITKIQKILPNNDHCKYLMKNLNQTNKHFIRFILRHRSRLSLHAQTTHTNNSVQSELSAKRCKKRRFVPKILRNGKGTETNHLTFEDTKLKTSLSADQCATISSELTFLAARAKIKSRSRWRSRSNVNAGVIANTMERGQDEVIPGQLVVSRAFTPAILDVKLSGKDRKLSRTVSKPPEETRFANEAGQVNTRGKANDRHGRKTQVRPQNSSRGRAETSSVAPTRTPRGVKGGAEPTSRRSPGQPCRPQGGRATPLLPARRTLRTRPSHFFRLFYLCTLREALISPELQEKQKSVAKNMKMIKSHSEPKLGPCLSQLPDCCRVHPSLSEGPPGQNRQAGLKVGHRTRLTAQLSGERSSGDAGSKERDCTGPPLCEQDISGVPKRTKSLDLQTKSPQPTGGRHVFPEVRGNETCKDLPERNSAVNQESVRFFVGSEDGSKQTSDESSQPPLNCCAEMLSIERHDAPEQGTPCRAGEPVSSESERDQSSDKKASRMTTTGIDVETGNVTATAPDQPESLEENLTTLLAVKETDTKQLDVSCGNDVLERNDKEILTGTSVGIQVGGLEPAMAQENYQDARLEAEAGGCSAQEVVQGLLLELVASVCQEVSSPLQERARARGAVRKMLEQYLSGADPESPELPELADRRARSCEIRTLPRGVVRERREMFARMRVFEVCSEGGRSLGGGPEVPRPPSARQVPLADALVPASPAAPLVGHTSHLAPDTCTTSFPTLLLVLVLCSVLKIVSNILTDNL